MRYPSKRAAAMRTLTIPDMAGGINTRDGISDIQDNQVSAANNLWYKRGTLRTRPGVVSYAGDSIAVSGPMRDRREPLSDDDVKIVRTNIRVSRDDKDYSLFAVAFNNTTSEPNKINVLTYLVNGAERRLIGGKQFYITKTTGRKTKDIRLFFAQYKSTLYLFNGEEFKIYAFDEISGWRELSMEDIYAPLVAINLSAFGDNEADAPHGTMVDGYNLIGKYYKAEYTTVNTALFTESVTSHKMQYLLLNDISKIDNVGLTITVTYDATDEDGKLIMYTHSATIVNNEGTIEAAEADEGEDGLKIHVTGNVLRFLDENDDVATVTIDDLVHDNMTVTAPVSNNYANYNKVFASTAAEWFGGGAEGISGGTRLFLGGNTSKDNKSIAVWSALNNPLYFPENNYAYVGASDSAVTAFGKQSNSLIIFKEDEIYSTHYTQGNLSAEAVENQSLIDVEASSAIFPITLLTSQIGCDLPYSVQLCSNRLVWACKDRKVYTLVTENQYSERNVYAASAMISETLPDDMSGATSADWEGCYWLFCGGKAFVMDYESYGFRYISSYSKVEDAASRIPWWMFTLPYHDPLAALTINGVLLIPTLVSATSAMDTFYYIDFARFSLTHTHDWLRTYTTVASETTHEVAIPTALESKVFEFSSPQYNKNIYQVDLGLRANGGIPIRVSYMTESAERDDDDYVTCAVNASDRSSRNIQNVQLRPALRGVSRFGIRLECDGGMELNHIAINYTITGGAK